MTSASYESAAAWNGRPLRIVLVTGEPVFRSGFRVVLTAATDLLLVAEAADARAGFRAVDAERPDLVVIDVSLPGMDGTSATREVKRRAPSAHVLLLAAWPRERDLLEGFAAGAEGFALKTEPVEALLTAMRTVGHGQRYISPDVAGMNLERLLGTSNRGGGGAVERGSSAGPPAAARPAPPVDVLGVLSPREREVLELVLKGWRNREIARELCVSIKTVDTHRTRINRKLGCRSAGDLIRFGAANGLLDRVPAAAAPAPTQQTIVLLMDHDPDLHGRGLLEVIPEGYQQACAPTLTRAMTELAALRQPAVFMLDPGEPTGRPAVRAVALLPDAATGEQFLAALERLAARSYSHGAAAGSVSASNGSPGAGAPAA